MIPQIEVETYFDPGREGLDEISRDMAVEIDNIETMATDQLLEKYGLLEEKESTARFELMSRMAGKAGLPRIAENKRASIHPIRKSIQKRAVAALMEKNIDQVGLKRIDNTDLNMLLEWLESPILPTRVYNTAYSRFIVWNLAEGDSYLSIDICHEAVMILAKLREIKIIDNVGIANSLLKNGGTEYLMIGFNGGMCGEDASGCYWGAEVRYLLARWFVPSADNVGAKGSLIKSDGFLRSLDDIRKKVGEIRGEMPKKRRINSKFRFPWS